jgi:large subunit ribosomal protein L21
MMEAVIATGGKQYRVTPGQVIAVERLPGEPGTAVQFSSVLLVTRDGEVIAAADRLRNVRVAGEVVAQGRARKVEVVKFKRRKNYRRHRGHRQALTRVRITTIEV